MPDAVHEQSSGRNEWTGHGEYYEYSKAANPIGAGLIPPVPVAHFPHSLHEEGDTRVIPFDLSEKLQCPWPATSPTLLANFIRIRPGQEISTIPNATSELYYVIRGCGRSEFRSSTLRWCAGDIFTLPSGCHATHRADDDQDAAFYWVHDEPLLTYLGVRAESPRFEPTLYPRDRAAAELEKVAQAPDAAKRNRVSVLLANSNFPQTRTVTHVIWSMFGVLPAHSVQLPHHHESVALDLIIDAPAGCYSMIGESIDEHGHIQNPRRADWVSGSAFVTPPGLWHSHHNESAESAHLLPIQDAGLHTHLRTLDIHFYRRQQEDGHQSYISLKARTSRP